MLVRIGKPENIPAFLDGVKNKKEKLFGFGHRVYKNFDPRAKLIQQIADEVRNAALNVVTWQAASLPKPNSQQACKLCMTAEIVLVRLRAMGAS